MARRLHITISLDIRRAVLSVPDTHQGRSFFVAAFVALVYIPSRKDGAMKVALMTCRKCGGTKLETEVDYKAVTLYWWCTRCQLCIMSMGIEDGTNWEARRALAILPKER